MFGQEGDIWREPCMMSTLKETRNRLEMELLYDVN
jgi:hypothetical protein